MPIPLLDGLISLARQLRASRGLFLCCDFDGTLVPIRNDPSACFLDAETAALLSALNRLPLVHVGIVSGRELNDLRPRLGVPGITIAGNHGLEIEGDGICFRESAAHSTRPLIADLVGRVALLLPQYPGSRVEDKGLTATIHYRVVAPHLVPQLLERVRDALSPWVAGGQILLRGGKQVLEIRPPVDWNKGHAINWLARQRFGSLDRLARIYLGDDETDEDSFVAWADGVTIRVGTDRPTAARYFVQQPAEVLPFLRWLLAIVQGLPAVGESGWSG